MILADLLIGFLVDYNHTVLSLFAKISSDPEGSIKHLVWTQNMTNAITLRVW